MTETESMCFVSFHFTRNYIKLNITPVIVSSCTSFETFSSMFDKLSLGGHSFSIGGLTCTFSLGNEILSQKAWWKFPMKIDRNERKNHVWTEMHNENRLILVVNLKKEPSRIMVFPSGGFHTFLFVRSIGFSWNGRSNHRTANEKKEESNRFGLSLMHPIRFHRVYLRVSDNVYF